MSEKTTPVARMEAAGRNPGNVGETGTPDSAALHPGYGTWAKEPLGFLVSFEYGKGLPTETRTNQGYPVLGSSGVVGHHSDFIVEGPGIVIGRKGTVGSITWVDTNFWPIDTTYYVETKQPLDIRWLYWKLQALGLHQLDSSTGVPGLNRNDAYEFLVEYPEVEEQRRISEILDTLDDAIQKTEQLIAKLKQIRQGLLHDLLTRGIDENGQLRDPIAHPEQFKDSVLGRIPKEWGVRKLGEVLSMQAGTALTSDHILENGPYPVYGGNGMRGYTSTFTHDGMFVLIGRQGALCGNIVVATGKFFATEHAVVVTPMEPTSVGWLGYYLTEMNLNRYSESSAQPGLSVQKISRLPIAVPRFEEQSAIDSILLGIERDLVNELNVVQKYNSIKNGLMHDLLTGKVRVTSMSGEQYV